MKYSKYIDFMANISHFYRIYTTLQPHKCRTGNGVVIPVMYDRVAT